TLARRALLGAAAAMPFASARLHAQGSGQGAGHWPNRPVRLVGVSLSNLTGVAQLSWLAGPADGDRRALNQTLDDLRRRHGLWVVSRGTHLEGSSRRGGA
ncbi:MAG: hypothetical protein ACK46X_21945, partial [Candidatus Sericytochromatia bacterium]